MLSLKEFISTQEQLLDLLMLEALSPEQERLAKKWSTDNKSSRQIDSVHDTAFGGSDKDRVTIPLERSPRDHSENPIHNTIKSHLERHGYSMGDYDKGTVTDKHGRETSVGKALGKTKAEPTLMQKFNNDPSRQSAHAHATGKSITISRHPLDVAGMSTGRKWDQSSCMRIGSDGSAKDDAGCNRHFIKADMKHGTLAAYVHDDEDKNLENPHSRVLLKRFDSGHSSEQPIFRPEGRIYGDQNKDIHHTINKWAEKHYPAKDDAVYGKHPDLYNDDGKSIHASSSATRKFNPKILDRYVSLAGMQHDADRDRDSHGFGEYESLGNRVITAMHKYKESLPVEERKEYDKHSNIELATRYHENEGSRYSSHWSDSDNYHSDDPDHVKLYNISNDSSIHPEHVDEIARAFTDSHKTSHGDHTTAEHRWDELEDKVLKHGSDKSKADVLLHHGTYGYETPEDTEFDARRHIVGKHTAKAWYDKMAGQHEGSDYSPAESHYGDTHENMAKHADDETFHNWLHSDKVNHDADSYKAMAEGASTKRQHKMLDDLKFDNSEHNGDVDDKVAGLQAGSKSKSVMKRIIGDKSVNKDVRRDAIFDIRHSSHKMTESKQ